MLGSDKYDGKLYSLKIRTRDKNKKDCSPHFTISTKEDGEWVEDVSSTESVSGDLKQVKFGSYEWNDDIIDTVTLYIEDEVEGEKEVYKIDMSYNILSKNIFNSLLALPEDTSNIEISLWRNKKGYATASLRQNGEIIPWAYDIKDLPEAPTVIFKNKEMRDYTEVDEFFREKLKERFGGGQVPQKKTAVNQSKANLPSEVQEEEEDEIPF